MGGEPTEEGLDGPFPSVPLDRDPCEVAAWMASHEGWTLGIADDLDATSLRALYQRFADSPCPSDAIFGEIAGHPNAPPDVLRALAKRRTWEIDLGLGVNPSTPVDVLVKLSHRR